MKTFELEGKTYKAEKEGKKFCEGCAFDHPIDKSYGEFTTEERERYRLCQLSPDCIEERLIFKKVKP